MQAILETDEQIKRRKKGIGSKNHSGIQFNIIAELVVKYYGKLKAIPELSLDINGSEKIPDLSFYRKFKVTPGNDETQFKNMPLGVVEILSPTQALTDLVVKANMYFDAGIQSYWLVAPEVQSVYVYSEKGNFKVFTHNDVLKDEKLDIELDLAKIF